MEEKTFSDPLEPLSEDANRAMLGCCEELAKDASDAMWMMDDIVRRAEENIRLWNDNNKYARLVRNAYECKYGKPKEIDMEEKKTMTKAEAFEYFKGKRVACDNFNCVAIQHKFFDVGIKWRGGSTKATDERGSFIFVDLNGYLTHCNSRTWFDTHEYEEISADDILSIEIVDGEDNIAEKNAFQQARDIMKWLREEQSPHTLMIIDGYHVELLDGVKAEVWKE